MIIFCGACTARSVAGSLHADSSISPRSYAASLAQHIRAVYHLDPPLQGPHATVSAGAAPTGSPAGNAAVPSSSGAHGSVAGPSAAFLHHAGPGAASTLGEALGGDGLAEYWYSEPPSSGTGSGSLASAAAGAGPAKHRDTGAFAAEADFGGEPLPDSEGASASPTSSSSSGGVSHGQLGSGTAAGISSSGRISPSGGVAELAALDAAHAAGELPPAHSLPPLQGEPASASAGGPSVHDVATLAYDAQAPAATADGRAARHHDQHGGGSATGTAQPTVNTPVSLNGNGAANPVGGSHEAGDGSPFEFVCLEHVLVTMAARQHKRVAYAGRVLEAMLNRVSTVQKDDSRLLALFPLGNTLAHYELVSRGLMECVRALLEDPRDMREACLTEKGKRASGEWCTS